MKMQTFTHKDFKHKFLLTEEQVHYGIGKRWTMQQLDEKGNLIPREEVLNETQYANALRDFEQQGWKEFIQD